MIIDDSTKIVVPGGMSTGYQGMFSSDQRRAALTTEFPRELLIPRHEWQARADEMQQQRSSLWHILQDAGWRVKNQARTNYCWIFSPVSAFEMLRVAQNQPYVSLSPASCGGPITGYQNRGGYGEDGMQYIGEKGIVPSSMWPDTAIDSRYDTPETRGVRAGYRAPEWMHLDCSNLDQVVSCLLRRIPVSGGFDWWGHQVTLVNAIWRNGEIQIPFANTWDHTWGDNGYGTLAGNRRLPGDAVAPRVAMAG